MSKAERLARMSATKRRRATETLADRVLYRMEPEPNSGCWLWTGARTLNGYGFISYHGRNEMAHRIAYGLFVGPIPEGKTLDHLCRQRACINPKHLEPVTLRENVLRNTSLVAANAVKTHCLRGHPLSGDNLYTGGGQRACRACRRTAALASYHRRRATA